MSNAVRRFGAISMASRMNGFDKPSVWTEFDPLAIELGAVNLGQGFPNWETPSFVKEAAIMAINRDHNQVRF